MNEDYMRKICNANREYLGRKSIPETFPCNHDMESSVKKILQQIECSQDNGDPFINEEELNLAIHRIVSLMQIENYSLETDKLDMQRDYESELAEKDRHIEHLSTAMRNSREVYIGMDGFKPETAPEAYCMKIIEQMYQELCDKSGGDNA